MAIAYLNGEWIAPEDARVSVFDRGFMFGDGIYEVMAVYGHQVFTLDQHVARLHRSLDAIRIKSPHDDAGWRDLILLWSVATRVPLISTCRSPAG